MKTLQEIQKEVYDWSVKTFGDINNNISLETGVPCGSWNALFGLMEELGELARTHICANQGRKGYDDEAKRRRDRIDAACDAMIFLCDYAAREGFDLQEELHRTWTEIVSKRTLQNWEQHNHEPKEQEWEFGTPPLELLVNVPVVLEYYFTNMESEVHEWNSKEQQTRYETAEQYWHDLCYWRVKSDDRKPIPTHIQNLDGTVETLDQTTKYAAKLAKTNPLVLQQTGQGFAEPSEEVEEPKIKRPVMTGEEWAEYYGVSILGTEGWLKHCVNFKTHKLVERDFFILLSESSAAKSKNVEELMLRFLGNV